MKLNKAVPIATIVLLAVLGLSAYAYTFYLPSLSGPNSSISGTAGPGTGTLNIYLTDSPPSSSTLKYLLVNVTSVTLRYSSNVTESSSTTSTSTSGSTTGTTSSSTSTTTSEHASKTEHVFVYEVPASKGTNVNLTKLQGTKIFLGAPKVPSGKVTQIILNITGAEAFWTSGGHTQLKVVADGKLMIPIHFTVFASGTTNLTLDIVPNDIHISAGNMAVLSPVIHVTVVSEDNKGTTETETAQTSATGSSTITTTSTSTTTT